MTEAPLAFVRPREPKPEWLKVRAPGSENYLRLRGIMRGLKLNTVCEDAHCPNIGECWHHGTATFMILGDVCTRACAYCAVAHGKPTTLDLDEPRRVAEAVKAMGLKYAVVTSVDRDDQADGGAGIFAETIREIRVRTPDTRVEVLIPDFKGDAAALHTVLDARPDVLNHNTETVPRLYRMARSGGKYSRTLELLDRARHYAPEHSDQDRSDGRPRRRARRARARCSAICARSACRSYDRPVPPAVADHAVMTRYYHPDEFQALKRSRSTSDSCTSKPVRWSAARTTRTNRRTRIRRRRASARRGSQFRASVDDEAFPTLSCTANSRVQARQRPRYVARPSRSRLVGDPASTRSWRSARARDIRGHERRDLPIPDP